MARLGGWAEIVLELAGQADRYEAIWKKWLGRSFFDEPLPITSRLLLVDSYRDDTKSKPFTTPQAAIDDAISNGAKVIFVQGDPGQGKSLAMLWAAYERSIDLACPIPPPNSNILIPLFDRLSRIRASSRSLNSLIERRPRCFTRYPGVFFFDGLDTLSYQGPLSTHLHVLNDAIELARDNNVVVISSRPLYSLAGVLNDIDKYWIVILEGLDCSARDKWLAKHSDLAMALDKIYSTNPLARELARIPLLFNLLLVFISDNMKSITGALTYKYPGRAGLFSAFLGFLYKRGVEELRLDEGHTYGIELSVFSRACWYAMRKGAFGCIPGDWVNVLVDRCDVDSWNHAVNDLSLVGVINQPEVDGSIQFIHQEFMEHLAGRHLAKLIEEALYGGWVLATLWDQLSFPQFDNLLAHAVGQVDNVIRRTILLSIQNLLYNSSDLTSAIKILFASDPDITHELLQSKLGLSSEEIGERIKDALQNVSVVDSLSFNETTLNLNENLSDSLLSPPNLLNVPSANFMDGEGITVSRSSTIKYATGNIIFRNAIDVLLEAAVDDEPGVREFAIRELGNTADPSTMAPVMAACSDPDPNVRWNAINSLKNYDSPQVLVTLLNSRGDSDDNVAAIADDVIRKIPPNNKLNYLLNIVNSPEPDNLQAVIMELGNIKATQAVDVLIKYLYDDNQNIRSLAAKAIHDIDYIENIENLIRAINMQVGTSSSRILAILGDTLANALKKEYPSDPMEGLELAAGELPDSITYDIAKKIGRRWCGTATLKEIKKQRLIKDNQGEQNMGKYQFIADTITVQIAEQGGINNVYGSPDLMKIIEQSLNELRAQLSALTAHGQQQQDALSRLDGLATAIKQKQPKDKVKAAGELLQASVNVLTLPTAAHQLIKLLSTLWLC